MANRLRGRPDGASFRVTFPRDLILRDWENLTGTRVESWQRPTDPRNPAADGKFCAADPKGPIAKREAVGIITKRYGFASQYACVKFLERQGVHGLPALRDR